MAEFDPRAALLRANVLRQADVDEALQQANLLIGQVNDVLNASGVDAATSLTARALVARGVLIVAGDWYADLTGAPKEATRGAIRSLADNPPVGVAGESFIDASIAREGHR